MFCPKCGSILIPKRDGTKKMLVCSCGYRTGDVEQAKIKETVPKPEKEVEVVDANDMHTLPLTDVECEKCGHKKAYFWTMQTRAGDEPETKFLRCEKCSHTWRDYS